MCHRVVEWAVQILISINDSQDGKKIKEAQEIICLKVVSQVLQLVKDRNLDDYWFVSIALALPTLSCIPLIINQ